MPATFNHTIIASLDGSASARFYTELLEAEAASSWGPFTNVALTGGVVLQFAAPPVEIQMQHYAFLVDDAHFDRAYAWLVEQDVPHWADPQMTGPGRPIPSTGAAGSTSRTQPDTG